MIENNLKDLLKLCPKIFRQIIKYIMELLLILQ